MPHGVESTITLSERDLARGAMDLLPEENWSPPNMTSVAVNNTVLETAVSIVREAGPKVIEAIATRLVPALRPRIPEVTTVSSLTPSVADGPVGEAPDIFTGLPVETIVIVSPRNYSVQPPVLANQDTVCIYDYKLQYGCLTYVLYSTCLRSALSPL
jgi:hypothetical protein